MRAGRQYWHGTGGAAIAFGVGIVGGGLTSLGTASVFESITVGCLASIVTFLLELKLGEAPSRHSALLVDQLTGVEWLRDSVTEIAAAVVASRSSHPVVQARLRGDIELLAHKAQEAPTNRIIRSFVDNKVRLTLTHGLKRDLFAVTYDAVDFEIWGKETELGYFEAQKKFIARGGHIARIFILENRTDNLLQTMREHVDAGIHVYEVDASTLRERPQRRSLLHNLVVWDRTCCSTTFIPVGGEPWETTYSFVDEEIRQAAQDWRMLVSLSNRVPGPGRWAAPGCVRCLPTGPATRPRAVAALRAAGRPA
ncbi:MAG TPA: hypothetical protein VES42_26835, partial [Pilimelia sp.]|nr:hypothetical protein [Pilimelia sp.]